jgi:multidrug efflux pump subunit AcrB
VAIGWGLFVAIPCIPLIGRHAHSAAHRGRVLFEVNLPQGASLAATDRVIAQLEAAAAGTA